MKWFGIMFIAVLLACAPGFGRAQQPKDNSPCTQPQGTEVKGEAAGTATSCTPEERNAYEKKIAAELNAIQQKIADLRIQASTGPPQNKRMLSLAANNIQRQKIVADNELIALENSSKATWGQQKAKLDKAMEKLRSAW